MPIPYTLNPKPYGRGQVMLIGLLLLSGIMGLGLSIGFFFIKEAQVARETPESVQAIYAADSGVELVLYNYFKTPYISYPFPSWTLSNGAIVVERRLTTGAATSVEAIGQSARGRARRGLGVSGLP